VMSWWLCSECQVVPTSSLFRVSGGAYIFTVPSVRWCLHLHDTNTHRGDVTSRHNATWQATAAVGCGQTAARPPMVLFRCTKRAHTHTHTRLDYYYD
jgi:hypothetical protein